MVETPPPDGPLAASLLVNEVKNVKVDSANPSSATNGLCSTMDPLHSSVANDDTLPLPLAYFPFKIICHGS